MNKHVGSCRILFMGLQQLLPEVLLSFAEHQSGTSDECFQKIIVQFAELACSADTTLTALEFADICKQVAEFFEPIPGDPSSTSNQFNHHLRKTLQNMFTQIRNNKFIYKSYDEQMKLQEAIQSEKRHDMRKALNIKYDIRCKTFARATGVVKLIAALFNVGILNYRIIELCVKHILCDPQDPSELDIECFQIIYAIAGPKLESQPSENKIVDLALSRLEEIIDKRSKGQGFCERINTMIIDIFEKHAISYEQPQAAANKAQIPDEANKEAYGFLKEINAMMSKLNANNLLDCLWQLTFKTFSQDQLKGTATIIFERSLLLPVDSSCCTFLCKGLANVSAQPQGSTFKQCLLSLCYSEITAQRDNCFVYREIAAKIEALKVRYDAQAKAVIEKTMKMHHRACRFAAFYGELFNLGMLEGRQIFDYLTILSSPTFISNTSIDSYCLLVRTAGTNLLGEVNGNAMLKGSVSKLRETSKSMEISPRCKLLIQNLLDSCRHKLKVEIDEEDDFLVCLKFSSMIKPNLSLHELWEPFGTKPAIGSEVPRYLPIGFNLKVSRPLATTLNGMVDQQNDFIINRLIQEAASQTKHQERQVQNGFTESFGSPRSFAN